MSTVFFACFSRAANKQRLSASNRFGRMSGSGILPVINIMAMRTQRAACTSYEYEYIWTIEYLAATPDTRRCKTAVNVILRPLFSFYLFLFFLSCFLSYYRLGCRWSIQCCMSCAAPLARLLMLNSPTFRSGAVWKFCDGYNLTCCFVICIFL